MKLIIILCMLMLESKQLYRLAGSAAVHSKEVNMSQTRMA